MPNIIKSASLITIQKNKKLNKSIEPLPKYYFLVFIVWSVSIHNLYSSSTFLSRRYNKRIPKKIRQIGNDAKKPSIAITIMLLFLGLVQVFTKYTGLSVFELLTNNLLILKTNICEHNWKTFHIADSPYLLRRPPNLDHYQKIDFLNHSVSLTLTPFSQNQRNQLHFGFISLKPIHFTNIFQKNKTPIYIQQTTSNFFDTIPIRIEGISGKIQKKQMYLLLKEEETQYKKDSLFILEKSFLNKKNYFCKKIQNLNKRELILLKKITPHPSLKRRLRFKKIRKVQNFKTKEVRNFFKKTQFKKIILNFYRKIFYKDGYKILNPKVLSQKKYRRRKKVNTILRNLILQRQNYLDIFEIIQKTEIGYFNSNLRPRFCSGYQYPDIEKRRSRLFLATNPLTINAPLPSKYRSFFMNSFLTTIKKRKTKNILYPTPKRRKAHIDRNVNYHKRFTVYKKVNFLFSKQFFGWRPTFKISLQSSPKTLLFKNSQFYEIREPIQPYSWLIVTKWGVGALGFKLFQYLYQEYGKEIVLSLINLIGLFGILQDSEWLKEELNLDNYEKGYRAVRKVKKSFKQAAGITPLLAYLSNTLWYLRSKQIRFSRFFYFFNYQSKKNRSFLLQPILLVGPPGTGKTLLVQAMAGEIGVPVLLQSGGVLKDFRQRGKGARSIQNLFRRARQVAPCVVFIDEVDGVGVRRESLSLSPMGEDDTVEILNDLGPNPPSFEDLKTFHPKTQLKDLLEEEAKLQLEDVLEFGETLPEARQKSALRIQVLQELQFEQHSRTEQLGMLTQLLIELDGLNSLNDIMVLGATNRPYVLDPALLRPGRFYRVLTLNLPDQKKRIEILKLYTSLMNVELKSSAAWRYLSQRMEGLSAADISAIVNESALISICKEKKHTIQSLEKGIERIISYSSSKNLAVYKRMLFNVNFELRSRWLSNYFFRDNYQKRSKIQRLIKKTSYRSFLNLSRVKSFIFSTHFKRLAYYQSGKSIIQILLPQHPSSVYFAVQEREKNFRYMSMHGLILNFMDVLKFRSEFEERLIGLLAGKSSEFISSYASIRPHLKNIGLFSTFNASNIGEDDTHSANLLAFLMIEKWYFYAEQRCTYACHPILHDFNFQELYPEDLKFFEAIFEDIESEIDTKNRLIFRGQKWSFRTWWQKQLLDEESFFDRSLMDWYRIYCSEPEESERNIEWVPPDEYYNALNIRLKDSFIYWHHFLKLTYDHLYHSLLLNCFNVGFSLLNKNRELLDYLVDFVLRHEKVRNPQIQVLTSPFLTSDKMLKHVKFNFKDADKEKLILFKDWGNLSRRRIPFFLNLKEIQKNKKIEKDSESSVSESFSKINLPKFLFKYPND